MRAVIYVPTDLGTLLGVEADIYGAWAVHVSHDRATHGRGKPKPALAITHVATGLRANHAALVGISKRDAAYVARRLDEKYPTLPDDVLPVARGERELSKKSEAFMKAVSEFIFETAFESRKPRRRSKP